MAFRTEFRRLAFSAVLSLSAGALACGTGAGGNGDDGTDTGGTDTGTNPDGDGQGTGGAGGPDGGTGGGAASGGSAGGTNNPGDYLFPESRGPQVPFSVYEAEAMDTTGQKGGPSRALGFVNSEASGRATVRLSAAGQYVAFTNAHAANALVIRYSIPDTGEAVKKLAVLVNDTQVALLDVTAKYAWSYRDAGDTVYNQPAQNDPGGGRTPHHFFDDVRAMVGDIPEGAIVKIQNPGGADAAGYYDIDLVEVEQVGAPLAMPGGYKSIVDCGATPNDGTDDTAAIQNCINSPGAGVFIPQGDFIVNSSDLQVANVNIRGAGMWYSTIRGSKASFWCWGGNCKYYDFSVFGETTARDDNAPTNDMAFAGSDNDNLVLENIWIEHRRAGLWTHGDGTNPSGTNVTVHNCRLRNLHADAINFYGGVVNGTVDNCHIRNTGDDGLAIWSHQDNGRPTAKNIVFKHNYVMAPWKANCFGIYGGEDISIEDNVCSETTTFAGMLIANAFDSHPFTGTNSVTRNTLLRAGGQYLEGQKGALILEARDGNTENIHVDDLDITDPTFFGVQFAGPNYIGYSSINAAAISNTGSWGFFVQGNSKGAIDVSNTSYTGNPDTDYSKDSGSTFTINVGAGNSGWSTN